MLPGALGDEAEDAGAGSSRRIEALLGYFYRDLKRDLDGVRQDQARLREMLRDREGVPWLEEVEVEPAAPPAPPSGDGPREEREAAERISLDVGASLADLERQAIVRTLESVGGNRRRAAEILGIGERTLYRKLKEYEL